MADKSVKFSQRQREAIEWDDNKELLISAAAGSGKTTVLINRIIDRIVNKRIPIDAFLVVTFTHASANELKEKIFNALNERIKQDPDDEWLSVQLANVGRASIGTMHSFCLKAIKDYHEHPSITLPKSTRILNEEKSAQLLSDAIDEILTDEYSKEDNQAFVRMLDAYASFKNDDDVRKYVKKLYKFALNNEDPYLWLDNNAGKDKNYSYVDLYFSYIKKIATETKLICDTAARNYGTNSAYTDMLKLSSNIIGEYIAMIDDKNYTGANSFIAEGLDFINIKGGRVKDEEVIIQKNVLKYVKNEFIPYVTVEHNDSDESISMEETLEELCRITSLVGKRFEEKKRRAKSVDYSDMEHLTLNLLKDESVAGIYRSKFKHILFDEYQDCNRLQEMIIQKISGESVYFMVGDVKQSVYGFRQAEPGLFLKKYNSYKYDPCADYAAIELNENYRSRKNVLNAANQIFYSVMKRDFCGMEYCAENALNAAAFYPDAKEDTFENEPVKLMLIMGKNTSVAQKLHAQTLCAVNTIKDFMKRKYVYDAKNNRYRRIRYSDIAILMRSPKNIIGPIKETFSATEIPINIMQDNDIRYAPEINLLICILQCIENPYNDLALMTTLHSYIFDVTDNELMRVMNADNNVHSELIAKIGAYIASERDCANNEYKINGINEEILCKLKRFMEKYSEWTENERFMPILDFIDYILDSVGYIEYFGSFENGQNRRENILRLCDFLKQQLELSSGGLYECCKILKNIDENGLTGNNSAILPDAVSVMSVHKSKGLEFPVVFIIDADRSFSDEEIKSTILMHKDYGMVSREIDVNNRLEYSVFNYEMLKRVLKKEQKEEEQRILYVAMTRAREQLIILGSISDKTLNKIYMGEALLETGAANNFIRWILYGLSIENSTPASPINAEMLAGNVFKRTVEGTDYISYWKLDICNIFFDEKRNSLVCKADDKEITLSSLAAGAEESQTAEVGDTCYRNNVLPDIDVLMQKISYKYPFEAATKVNSKLSVSQIKHIAQCELDDDTFEIPDYRYDKVKTISSGADITPTRLGSLYHFFMQHANIVYPYRSEDFKTDIERMLKKKLITPQEAERLDEEKFLKFFNSDIGKRMAAAPIVEREKNFTYYAQANKIFTELNTDEKILVQGVIDCYFCDDKGKYTLIDYKTDKVAEGAEALLIDRHIKQIELYKSALRDIAGINITEAYVYSFALGKFISAE